MSSCCFSLPRLCVLLVSGNILHVPAKHVLCSTSTGEGGGWNVLFGSHSLPLLLVALPYSLLPFRRCVEALLQVSSREASVSSELESPLFKPCLCGEVIEQATVEIIVAVHLQKYWLISKGLLRRCARSTLKLWDVL